MSLTGKPKVAASAPVANDGFWPELSLADLMSKYRIPAEYADATISWGFTLSLVRVNNQLERAKTAIIELGVSTFDAYLQGNSQPIADAELLDIYYQHAVFARSKAFLLQQFNTLNRRKDAEHAAIEAGETEQFWLDESQSAISNILKHFFSTETFVGNGNVHVASL